MSTLDAIGLAIVRFPKSAIALTRDPPTACKPPSLGYFECPETLNH
jgi:hypothetical protein